MKTKEQIEKEFRSDLNGLLKKYRAEISITNYSDIGVMEVFCTSKMNVDCTELIEESARFDLGDNVYVD